MTRAHRRGHLVLWLVLTPVIFAVLIAGVVARSKANAELAQDSPQGPSTPEKLR